MGPRAGLDRWGKSCRPPGFDPRTVRPVASRDTDYATRPNVCIAPRVNHALGVSESHLVTILTSVSIVSVRSAGVERETQRSRVTGQQR